MEWYAIISFMFSIYSPFLLWWYLNPSKFLGIMVMVIVHVILSHVLWCILYRRKKNEIRV